MSVSERIVPARWSWLHWWEANRDQYLEILRQGRGQKPDQNVVAKYRDQAADLLLEGLKSEHGPTRARAALALGQMSHQAALGPLIQLASGDKDEGVRTVALVAIGLLDSADADRFLRESKPPSQQLREATLCSLGLISSPGPDALAGLQQTVYGADPGAAVLAAWGLRRHPDAANEKFLKTVLSRTESPWLASEALLALGRTGTADGARMLAEILLGTEAGKDFPAMRALEARHKLAVLALAQSKAQKVAYGQAYQDYVKSYEAWRKSNPNSPPALPPQVGKQVWVSVGLELVYMARLRASAAIALGEMDTGISRQALVKCLSAKDDPYSQLYKGFAIMALGRLGEQAAAPMLADYLSPEKNGFRKNAGDLKSPLRGYAALALGMYCRPYSTPQGPADRPGFDKVCAGLGARMADASEEPEVRTACAMGLGLTGRTENLKYLQAASRTVPDNDDLMIGYTILARGMLADSNILEPAKKFLAGANDKQDMSGVLGRRAAVLGLGLTGSQQAVPILLEAWHLSYHVNIEVIDALALLQAYNVMDELVKLIQAPKNPWEHAYAVRCMGELFCKARPQRLVWLTNGSNYTLKNTGLLRYQALANEFLFTWLIPSFGADWQ
jgi:HEAT repeat protein